MPEPGRTFVALPTRRPRAILLVLGLLTVGFAALATTNEFEVDLSQLGSEDSHAVQAMQRLRTEFGDPQASVQVVLDAGHGGDVLDADGMAAVAAAEATVQDALGTALRTDAAGQPLVLSLPGLLGQAGPSTDGEPLGPQVAAAIAANPQAGGLVSDDLDVASGSARATVVLARLDPALDSTERTEAAQRVRDAFATDDAPELAGIDVAVFSDGLFVEGLLDAIRAEVPLLFGLALLVVLTILALMYRTLFDVLIGLAGLLATVVWTFGIVALLGPNNLALTGPLTQLAVIVPVLLVGLGIDYSVHLTSRYREQRAAGQEPTPAAERSLRTVGAALVLATVATAVGFASIATAPLSMLADFGVFVAVGVVCAFLIMASLVPAAAVLRDGRRRDADRTPADAEVREVDLGHIMRVPTRLAVRSPWAGLVVAAVLVGASLVAATGLAVEFDRDDFIPEGSDVAAALDHQQELFGGGITESTFVLIDGDVTDVEVANATLRAQAQASTIDGVRTVDGTPQIVSPFSLAASAARTAPVSPASVDGDGFGADSDLEGLFGQLRQGSGGAHLSQLIASDHQAAVVQFRTTTGDRGASHLADQVTEAFAPVVDAGAGISVTSEPIIIAEMSEELSAFQARAIVGTLVVVLVLLAAYYALVRRRPLLGVIALFPAAVSAALVVGAMWLLGIAFNVLTATLTAIAVGIGVPYGVHLVNRFVEDLDELDPDAAIERTLARTGGALTGSAVTTLAAFVVLAFSGLLPIRSLGLLGGAGITFSLLAAVLVEPGTLVAWARRRHPSTTRPTDTRTTAPRHPTTRVP